jgi:hypothetical protein
VQHPSIPFFAIQAGMNSCWPATLPLFTMQEHRTFGFREARLCRRLPLIRECCRPEHPTKLLRYATRRVMPINRCIRGAVPDLQSLKSSCSENQRALPETTVPYGVRHRRGARRAVPDALHTRSRTLHSIAPLRTTRRAGFAASHTIDSETSPKRSATEHPRTLPPLSTLRS